MYIQVVGGSNYRVPVRVISGALRLRGNASFSQVQRDTKLKRRTIALVQ